MRKPLLNAKLFFFLTLLMSLFTTATLHAQQIILPVEVLGTEGKTVSRTVVLSAQEAGRATKLWMQVNNLSYQNKASVRINNGAWLTLNHQTVTMQAQEKARGGMVHGGFNTIRFSIPVTGLIAGTNTISFRFDLSDGISNGYRVIKFNLQDAGGSKIIPDSRFTQDDPATWVGPYTDATSIQEGRNLWYNGSLKSHYLPAGRKGFWYGYEIKGQEVINAKCSNCHTQDGRDLEIFSYSNESIIERAKFHQLTEEEGKKIASYIRSLSTSKPNVGRWGRPWNPPYQPGPAVANMPVQQWAAGAGLDAVLEEDKDMLPYLFPNGVNQEEVYKHFDSDKTVDRTTLPLAIQFPDWKHWLPMIHPMDAYTKNDYYNQPKQYDPKKGYTDFRNYLTAQDPSTRNKTDLLNKSNDFRTHYRFFLAQGSPVGNVGGHWREPNGSATAALADGVSREMAATSLARLLAVQYFEIFNEFNLQDKASWFTKPGEYPGDLPKTRQWFGNDYHVFEVPAHFQACVNNNCNQFVGQPTETGFYESSNWYQLQLVIGGGEGMMSWNSPVDYNYHPDFLTKASNSSGIYEPLRYYHSMNAMYQTRTWVGGQNPNNGLGFRIRVMGPWNIYGISDGNQFNGFAPGEFAKQLDKVQPGMTAWVMNAMLKQFLKELNKPYNSLSGWTRVPDGDDNALDRADKTTADIMDAVQRTERQEGFFYHHAAKMYYYIPRFQKLGVDCQIMEDWITWCQQAWPLIDWNVFRNKGELQLSLQLADNKFCSGTNTIKAIGANFPTNPVFTWKVNGVTAATTGAELSTNNINPGDVVTCQVTNNSSCLAIKTVTATIVMPSKGYNLTMRKVGEANFRPLENTTACVNEKVELKLNIDLQPKQWLDAMDVNSGAEPTNGSKISSWWDKTGHGFNADANKTELQPTYLTNGLNGLPAIVFGNDNNADGLELFSTAEDGFMNNDWTIMFVGQSEKPTGNDDWRDIIGNKTEGANGWFWRFGSNARVQMGIGPELQHGKEYNFSRSYIVQITKKGDVITCYLNGRSDRVITKGANVSMRISDALYIGQSAGGNQFSNRYHKGPISELLVFESAITDAQKEFLEGYLTNKWKLNNELDYTHTYYAYSPFDISVNAPDGNIYKLNAITTTQTINIDQTNKFGTYNFVKDVCGGTIETMSVTNGCNVPQSPYGGTPWPIPGKIEVENYDLGGEGIAYHDNETTNYGGAFRTTDGVDVGNCPEGGYNIGWIGNGEWTEYTVNVATTGIYTLEARVATPNPNRSFHLELDGVTISGIINVPLTGSWDTYQTVSVTTQSLSAGPHVLRMYIDGGDFNFNYINFILIAPPVVSSAGTASGVTGTNFTYAITASNNPTTYAATGLPAGLSINTTTGAITGTPTTVGTFNTTVSATNAGGTGTKVVTITITNPLTNTPYLGTPWPIPGTIQAENYDDGGEGVAYHDNDVINSGGQQRTNQGVDVENTGDNLGGTHNVGWTNAGEWMKYTVNVATSGAYTLQVRVASPGAGNSIRFDIDGTPIATVAIPSTLEWQTYQTVSVTTSNITAGAHVLTIYELTGGFNLNYITFVAIPATPVVNSAGTASGTVGSAFTYNITASNTPTSYGATGLPAGLSVNTSTGAITGTPTAAGTFNATITATNAGGTGTKALTITIAQAAPVVSSAGTVNGTVGAAFSYNITASNTPTSYGATGLPAGLSVNTSTGAITGTPTAAGTFNATITATNAGGTGTKALTITIAQAAPVISSVGTANGTVGATFSYSITASNSPTSYGATGLPAGLSVNTSTGAITGTPTAAGTFNATITATNAGGTGTKALTITIAQAAPVVSSAGTVNGTVGAAFSYSITASNSPTSYGATGLPAGLSVNTSTGAITGTPTAVGTFNATVSATNTTGTGTKALTITVTNPTSTPYLGTPWPIPGTIQAENYDDGGEGIAYHDNDVINSGGQQRTSQGVDIENTGDNNGTHNVGWTNAGEWMKYTVNVQTTGVYTLQARVAAPGAGSIFRVELDGSTIGTINIPNTTGWQTYQTVSVITPSITAGAHVLRIYEETGGFNLNYIAFISGTQSAPVINSTTSATATLGNSFTYSITASNSPTSYNATGLPSGLTINTSTGVISGTPVNNGTSNVTISATNASGTGSAVLSLNVTVPNDPAGIITAYRNQNTITVNGNLNEVGWNLNKSITKMVFGNGNNTATFGALWDNTNLYIGVRVLDGSLYADSPEWWEDDAVELYIDANNNKLSTYDGLDNQIIKGYNKSGVSTKLTITGLQHAWAAISGGYTVEFAIPWSQLGISPTSGTTIGFDIGYNDDDNGGTREGQVMWNGTIDNWQNTSQFGTLRLNTGFAAKFGDNVTSLEYAEANAIRVQPTIITDGLLNVVVPSQWSGEADISILNVNGLLLQTGVKTIIGNSVMTNISELKQGMYFVKITKGSEVYTEKFIVQ